MVRLKNTVPQELKPYTSNGVELDWEGDGEEVPGVCPQCGEDDKFSVNRGTGAGSCFHGSCGFRCNALTFLRWLHEQSLEATPVERYVELAEDRGIRPETLLHWGVARSTLTGDWIIPAYDAKGRLCQLYRYRRVGERMALLASGKSSVVPGCGLFGRQLMDDSGSTVYLCEGPWDGMKLWEALGQVKRTDEGYRATASRESCLLADASVLSVPACSTFSEDWVYMFQGKDVCLLFDSDHPRQSRSGKLLAPAGTGGMRYVAGIVGSAAETLRYLDWGDGGYDPSLPSGYDLRDLLGGASPAQAVELLAGKLRPVPDEWLRRAKAGRRSTSPDLCPVDCPDYTSLTNAWRRAMKWTDGLDHALCTMLAAIASTGSVGDQLWIKVMGPASCGKSTLCEAVSVCREYVTAKSTIRGFHSGYKADGEGKEQDHGLIPLIRGKTLVTKDGDTLLTSPNLSQILAEARDLYDSTARTHYRNTQSKDYSGIRMTWLLCGTKSLRFIDTSELGERFLDCVIMEGIDDELEDEVLWRKVNQAVRSVEIEADGKPETQYDPDLLVAMRMTGGAVKRLRETAGEKLPGIEFPESARRYCARLGKFVAFMRAKPSKGKVDEGEREFAARLVSQLARLARCVALVLDRTAVDDTVMGRVRRVALDTGRGVLLSLASHLWAHPGGSQVRTLALYDGRTVEEVGASLRFMRRIGIARCDPKPRAPNQLLWRLTERFASLYEEVVDAET